MITKTYEVTINAESFDSDKFLLYLKETLNYLSRFIFTDTPQYGVKVMEADIDDGR